MSSLKLRISSLVAASTVVLGACATTGTAPEAPVDLATDEQRMAAERADPLTRARFWAGEYQKEPENIETAKFFAKALRDIESHDRVIEVASDTLILYPSDYDMLMLLGRSYLSQKKIDPAAQAFGRAISADNSRPDAFAALGLVYDRAAQHQYAQRAYKKALEIDPKRTTTLTNYGLSLALTGDIASAEVMLRKAANRPDANTQVRQNLALVLGLQGKFDEMKTVDELAPAEIMESNARVLQQMIQYPPITNSSLSPELTPSLQTPQPEEPIEASPATPVQTASLSDIQAPPSIEAESVSRPALASEPKLPDVQPEPEEPLQQAALVEGAPKNISPPKVSPTVEEILATVPNRQETPEPDTQTARLPGGLRGSLQD